MRRSNRQCKLPEKYKGFLVSHTTLRLTNHGFSGVPDKRGPLENESQNISGINYKDVDKTNSLKINVVAAENILDQDKERSTGREVDNTFSMKTNVVTAENRKATEASFKPASDSELAVSGSSPVIENFENNILDQVPLENKSKDRERSTGREVDNTSSLKTNIFTAENCNTIGDSWKPKSVITELEGSGKSLVSDNFEKNDIFVLEHLVKVEDEEENIYEEKKKAKFDSNHTYIQKTDSDVLPNLSNKKFLVEIEYTEKEMEYKDPNLINCPNIEDWSCNQLVENLIKLDKKLTQTDLQPLIDFQVDGDALLKSEVCELINVVGLGYSSAIRIKSAIKHMTK